MEVRHGRVSLWLEPVREGEGVPLLVLHALGSDGRAAVADLGAALQAWGGPVYALDFCGHGRSGRVGNGAYYAELMAADADAALAALSSPGDEVWVSGAGLGAYAALLLAGGRPDAVAGAILWAGPGLEGGGHEPDFDAPGTPPPPRAADVDPGIQSVPSTDPLVAPRLAEDLRPLDYVEFFAEAARRLWLVEDGDTRPPWWVQSREVPGALVLSGDDAHPAAVLAKAARVAGVAR
jgi:pimeloyl-ACP methyl ester carboxylesterase